MYNMLLLTCRHVEVTIVASMQKLQIFKCNSKGTDCSYMMCFVCKFGNSAFGLYLAVMGDHLFTVMSIE